MNYDKRIEDIRAVLQDPDDYQWDHNRGYNWRHAWAGADGHIEMHSRHPKLSEIIILMLRFNKEGYFHYCTGYYDDDYTGILICQDLIDDPKFFFGTKETQFKMALDKFSRLCDGRDPLPHRNEILRQRRNESESQKQWRQICKEWNDKHTEEKTEDSVVV